MGKRIISGEEARRSLKKGVDTLAHAVRVTLGPKGHCVALDKKWGGANHESFHRQFRSLRPQMARLGAHLDLIAREVNALVDRFESVDRS